MQVEPMVLIYVNSLSLELRLTHLLSAFVMEASVVQIFKDVGGVRPPDRAYVLNFCDPFFNMERMENQLETLQASSNLPQDRRHICDLDHLDSTARVMLHEWTQKVISGSSPIN